MKTIWTIISLFLVAVLLGSEAVNAYMMYGGYYNQPYYPSRNYYMMDYYQNPGYTGGYYNPYSYPYGNGYGYYRPTNPYSYMGGYYSNYYNDPNWKYYTLNTFTRGNRYGFY